jgi:hypothetical protein
MDTTTMDRVFLPGDWVKNVDLLKINLLPKNTTLLVNFFTSYSHIFVQPQAQTGLIII